MYQHQVLLLSALYLESSADLAAEDIPNAVPLTCTGHSRPVTHVHYAHEPTTERQHSFIASCKDNRAILRDGTTGDWIGTYLGHKGAIWQARLSDNMLVAATASADFYARVWDNTTGESILTLPHNHIVRSISFCPTALNLLLTGTHNKQLSLYDMDVSLAEADENKRLGTEIGAGEHQGSIKSILFDHRSSSTFLTACDDKKLRWWDLRARRSVAQSDLVDVIGSCEYHIVRETSVSAGGGGAAGGVVSVAAGKNVYFFSGVGPNSLIRTITFEYDVASVAVNTAAKAFVTGSRADPWVRIYDYEMRDGQPALEILKGHHGPVNSIQFSPDGKVFASGSEDGTVKIWKFVKGPYGLWDPSGGNVSSSQTQ
ncbi:MAG: hypothetical protein M1814_006796 [Vezdaea aestivalis]|nr:MAG: hypothetical protein M1814_006796 [Vezdaea aestivalis]